MILQNFRNYQFSKFSFNKINVITGFNGSGKTNLLEAISFVDSISGFRNATMKEASSNECGNFEILLQMPEGGRNSKIDSAPVFNFNLDPNPQQSPDSVNDNAEASGIGIKYADSSREITFENQPITQGDLCYIVKIIHLLPQDEFLLTSGVRDRRNFFDRITSFFFNSHIEQVKKYKQLSSERIKILQGYQNDEIWLNKIESEISSSACIVAINRVSVFKEIIDFIRNREDSFRGDIRFTNPSECWLLERDMTSLEYERLYREKLRQSREKDKHSGKTNFGVNKFDFEAFKFKKDKNALVFQKFLSSAEQKMILISIILACINSFTSKESTNRIAKPILLIDEITAKLDTENQKTLFDELCKIKCQVFLAGLFDLEQEFIKQSNLKKHLCIIDVSNESLSD